MRRETSQSLPHGAALSPFPGHIELRQPLPLPVLSPSEISSSRLCSAFGLLPLWRNPTAGGEAF